MSKKVLKSLEQQRHKVFPGLPELRSANKTGFLCAPVSLWFKAFVLFAATSKEGVAKDPEKKGTTKTRRHKVFSVLVWATLGRQKKSSFVPSCLCGSRLFTLCDTLKAGDPLRTLPTSRVFIRAYINLFKDVCRLEIGMDITYLRLILKFFLTLLS